MKKYDKANVRFFRNAYSGTKETPSSVSASYILVQTEEGYVELGDRDMAFAHIVSEAGSLIRAKKQGSSLSLMRPSLENLAKLKMLEKSDEEIPSEVDLVLDEKNHRMFVRGVGMVEFRSQYILLDLVRLFIQNQGSVYPKEYLVEHVWRQPYDPAIHDNKIYVTIRRLRRMIEPDVHRPTYLLKDKAGYCLNKSVRVYIKK